MIDGIDDNTVDPPAVIDVPETRYGSLMNDRTDEALRERLSPLQYEVTQRAGTERPFTGVYWDTKDAGTYRCVVCEAELFSSETKYDSGSGWPSFFEAIDSDAVVLNQDSSLGMARTEVVCSGCGAHLGHVFPDGPGPTGDRYRMNSASLRLDTAEPGEPEVAE